ncbi:MAG: hypothetical protein KDC54_08295, partial [Lewinella sp.]|nr:hypothetical protein [Lewinella sp.]
MPQFIQAQFRTLPPPQVFSGDEIFNHTRVWDIVKDDRGFVWVATSDGLFRFDGRMARFISHPYPGISPIENGQINDLCIDQRTQNLWIGHAEGLSILDLSTERFIDTVLVNPVDQQPIKGECYFVRQDRQGKLWVSNRQLGLIRLDTSIHSYPFAADKPYPSYRENPGIATLVQDPAADSIYWLGTFQGLMRFDAASGRYSLVDTRRDANDQPINTQTVFATPTHQLYLGNPWERRFDVYDTQTGAFHLWQNRNPDHKLPSFSPQFITRFTDSLAICLLEDQLALGMFNIYRDSLLQVFSLPNFVHSCVRFDFIDDQIWLSTDAGLLVYSLRNLPVQNYFASAQDRSIIALTEQTDPLLTLQIGQTCYRQFDWASSRFLPDSIPFSGKWLRRADGTVWMIGEEGILRLEQDQLIPVPGFEYLDWSKMGIQSLAEDQAGLVWIITRWNGVYRLNPANNTTTTYLQEGPFTELNHIFTDKSGNFWFGHYHGLSVYVQDQDTFLHFFNEAGNPLSLGQPRGAEQDDQGRIWVSGTAGGLAMIDGYCLEEGIRYKLTTRDGLVSNRIWALCKDQHGHIWMVNKKGLQVLDPKTLQMKNYGEAAGFILREQS